MSIEYIKKLRKRIEIYEYFIETKIIVKYDIILINIIQKLI